MKENKEVVQSDIQKIFIEIDNLFILLAKEAVLGNISSSFIDRYLTLRDIFPRVNNTLKKFEGDKNV